MNLIPAPVLLQLSFQGIQAYAGGNEKDETIVNFFRKTTGTDDDGYQNGNHIGYIQIDDLNETYNIFKETYPEELL